MTQAAAQAPDKVWYLKRINLFADLPAEDIRFLAQTTEMHQLPSRATVFTAGQPADKIYLLKTGRIKLSQIAPSGRELTLGYVDPGEIFGELSDEEGDERTTMAEAVESSVVCTMGRGAFEEFLSTRPALGLAVAKFFGFRLRRIETRLIDLLFLDVRSRILKVLRDLAQDFGEVTPRGIRLKLRLTHQDIANLIGATRETTTTTMTDLRGDGLLGFEGKLLLLPLDPGGKLGPDATGL